MSDLVTIDGQQVVTSSRNVAEHFEKRHADVLETIEKLKTENSVLTKMFFETTYKVDGNNKSYKEYLMNRDGFSLLVMGFTGAKALAWKLKYIEAFNAMEAKLADRGKDSYMIADPVDRAKKWIEEEEVRQRQAAELEAAKPKVVFADAVATSKTSILIGELAKLIKQNGIDIGQNRLFEWLRVNKFLISRKGTDYNTPTQKAMEMGLFEIKESSHINGDGVNIVTKTSKVTGKGQQYFINKFLAKKDGGAVQEG